MGRVSCRALTLLAIAIACGQTLPANALELVRTVALSGKQAVGTSPGSVWDSFGQPVLASLSPPFNGPVLNDLGQVAFNGALQIGGDVTADTDRGVWTEAKGSLNLLAREGDVPIGGQPGELYYDFYQLRIGNKGHTAFGAQLRVPGQAGSRGIWRDDGTEVSLIVADEMAAPGFGPDLVFRGGLGFTPDLAMNERGDILFGATLGPVSSPNTSGPKGGLWLHDAAGLKLVTDSRNVDPVLNDMGQVAFQRNAVQMGLPNDLKTYAESGKYLPAPLDQTKIYDFELFRPRNPKLNNEGELVFAANGTTGSSVGSEGIWAYRKDTYEVVALAGQHAPGLPAGQVFRTLLSPVINAHGDAAFVAYTGKSIIVDAPPAPPYEDTGAPFLSGVWREKNGVAELMAVEGGAPQGVGANESFARFDDLVLNKRGQVAFRASLVLPGETTAEDLSNYDSLWATDLAGQLHLIGRVGGELSAEYLGLGFSKTLASLSFTGGSGNEDGLPSGFNERGQVAFYATFTDGSSGVFVSNVVAVPEPTALLLMVGALGAVDRRGTRRRNQVDASRFMR